MAWSEHLGGYRYRIVERDPSKASRPKRSIVVEMPADVARSERKKEAWLRIEEAKWSELVIAGDYEDKGTRRSRSNKTTFKDFVPVWKKGYADQNMSGETLFNTNHIIDSRLLPEFGDTWLDEITTLELVAWFAGLANKKTGQPLATNTKLNIYKVAKSIFDHAHEWKVIRSNPMEGVARPSQSKKEKKAIRSKKQAYSRAETETLLVALYSLPERWRLYFTGALLGGFRRGELLAVEWPDLDYERGAIWIDKQITIDEEGRKTEAEVKTEESEDWVVMPRWYMDELKSYRRTWAKEKLNAKDWRGGDKQYIFCGATGEMYYPNTPTLTWRKFLAKQGLPLVKLHGLRHTAGMLLRTSGKDLKTIQERLRHTKIDTTANIYTHKDEAVSRDAVDTLESLNPKSAKFAP